MKGTSPELGVCMSVCILSLSSYPLSSSEPYAHILTLTLSHTHTPVEWIANTIRIHDGFCSSYVLFGTLTHKHTLTPMRSPKW
jgi:hypothetical protein